MKVSKIYSFSHIKFIESLIWLLMWSFVHVIVRRCDRSSMRLFVDAIVRQCDRSSMQSFIDAIVRRCDRQQNCQFDHTFNCWSHRRSQQLSNQWLNHQNYIRSYWLFFFLSKYLVCLIFLVFTISISICFNFSLIHLWLA